MKRFNKVLAMFLVVMMCVSMLAVTVSAKGLYYTQSGAELFNGDEWEYTFTVYCNSVNVGRMIYGFDTDFFNEDYVWSICNTGNAKSYLERVDYDEGEWSSYKSVGNYAKLEKTHKSATVIYGFDFTAVQCTLIGYHDESAVKP